jgi:hypothetical protein
VAVVAAIDSAAENTALDAVTVVQRAHAAAADIGLPVEIGAAFAPAESIAPAPTVRIHAVVGDVAQLAHPIVVGEVVVGLHAAWVVCPDNLARRSSGPPLVSYI